MYMNWLFDWIRTINRAKNGWDLLCVLYAKFSIGLQTPNPMQGFNWIYTNQKLNGFLSFISLYTKYFFFTRNQSYFCSHIDYVFRAYTTDQNTCKNFPLNQWQEYCVFRSWLYKPISDYCLGAWVIF